MNDVAQMSFDYPLAGVDSGPSAEPEPQPSNVQSEGMGDTDMNGPSASELVGLVCQKADESMESDFLVESELYLKVPCSRMKQQHGMLRIYLLR